MGREHDTCPINHHIHANWMPPSKKKKVYFSFTQPQGMSHCFSKQGFPCTQREHNWPPLLPAAALSSFRLAQAPSDVAHGHRKLKIKQRAVVTAHTEPSATHSSAGIMTQRAAMANVLVSRPPSPSIPPPSRAKQTVPPLIPVQKTYQQLWKHLCSRHKCEPGSSSPPKTTFEKSFRLGTTSTAAQRFKG